MKKMTRSQKQYALVGMITFLVIALAFVVAYFATFQQMKNKYETRLQEVEKNKKMAYVATAPITSGEIIDETKIAYREVVTSVPAESLLSGDDLGRAALVNIDADTHLLKSMAAPEEIQDDLKEEEYSLFHLSSNLHENDSVDIRILFPNGENYIVLSKKSLKNLNLEHNNCFLWLSEDEILSLSSAVIDAYLHKGAKLYTSKYIEPTIQEKAIPTYIPNAAVIALMKSDPNILDIATEALNAQARSELELRLDEFKEKSDGINWEDSQQADEEQTYSVDDIYDTGEETGSGTPDGLGEDDGEEIEYVD